MQQEKVWIEFLSFISFVKKVEIVKVDVQHTLVVHSVKNPENIWYLISTCALDIDLCV